MEERGNEEEEERARLFLELNSSMAGRRSAYVESFNASAHSLCMPSLSSVWP